MNNFKKYRKPYLLTVCLFANGHTFANDECGTEAVGTDTLNCTAGTYASGITYENSDGLTLNLNNPGIISDSQVKVSSTNLSTNTNDLSIIGTNFDTITVNSIGGGGGGLFVSAQSQESAIVQMDAGTITATGGATSALRTALANNPAINSRQAQVIFNGGNISATLFYAINSQVDSSSAGSSVVEMHGGTITGTSGIRAAILEASGDTSPNTSPATVVMDGGTINTSSTAIEVLHAGEASGTSLSSTVSGVSTAVNSGISHGIWLHSLSNISQGSYNVDVFDGAHIAGGTTGYMAIYTESHPNNLVTINITDTTTVVDGNAGIAGISDAEGNATITSSGQILGGIMTNGGDDTLYLNNGSTTTGAIAMGDGDDIVTLNTGANITGITSFDGGTSGSLLTDVLNFNGFTNYSYAGSQLTNWGRITARDGASLTITGGALSVGILSVENTSSIDADANLAITGGLDINTNTNFQATGGGVGIYSVTGAVTNAGTINMIDGTAGDKFSIDGTYGTFGGSGTLYLDVLNPTTTDSLHIMGSSSGTTSIAIANLGLPDVVGTTIPLVTIDGASNGVFTLSAPVTLTNVTYNLVQNINGGWDLVASANVGIFSIGGTVTNLIGTVVLQNNNGDDLTITADGSFTFVTPVTSAYAVTVLTQPTDQTCSVTNGSGTATANVTNVELACTTNTYFVGGSVNGLTAAGLVLQNNGTDDLNITSNGGFVFSQPLVDNSNYTVTVNSQPNSQDCTVINASGTIASNDVVNVGIDCTDTTYFIGVSVSGLTSAGLVLQNNGGDDLSITGNGNTPFSTQLINGSSFNVSIFSQPNDPNNVCELNGTHSGTVAGEHVLLSVVCGSNDIFNDGFE